MTPAELLTSASVAPAPTGQGRQLQVSGLAEASLRSLAWFVRSCWHAIEPGTPLAWNWHHELICAELEAVTRGDVRELVICIPPGFLKSILVSVMWPAWIWLNRPSERILAFSHVDTLAIRDGRRQRIVIESEWYQELVQLAARSRGVPAWEMASDQNAKTLYENTQRGFRQNLGIKAGVTGKRGDGQIVDDPYDAKQALLGTPDQVARRMADVCTIYDEVLSTRLNDPKTGWRVVIMQRLHTMDLAGVRLAKGVRCVVIPQEYDPTLSIRTPGGDRLLTHPADPRQYPGQLIHPERFGEAENEQAKVDLRAQSYAAQHGQTPTLVGGGLFKRAWLRQFYDADPQRLRPGLTEVALSVDCNFRETTSGSFFVCLGWGRKRKEAFYLLDRFKARCDYIDGKQAVRLMLIRWKPRVLLVEAKALGDALISDLKALAASHGCMTIAYDPGTKSKYERAQVGSAPVFESGAVWLPQPEWCPWVGDYIETHANFPQGGDDDVDATSQILIRWTGAQEMDALERTKRQWGGWQGH